MSKAVSPPGEPFGLFQVDRCRLGDQENTASEQNMKDTSLPVEYTHKLPMDAIFTSHKAITHLRLHVTD